jgi:hypothetical protein
MSHCLLLAETLLLYTWYMVGCTCLWYRLITVWCTVDARVYVDILISVEDCCLISVGAENVR